MKPGERKVALLAITEHIEMMLLSREDPCLVMLMQEEVQEHSFYQHQQHPLVPDCEEEAERGVRIQPRSKLQTELPDAQAGGNYSHALQLAQGIEIEMEIFPPFKVTESELVELKSDDPSVMIPPSPNKTSRLRWKRLCPQRTGLVVTDVICLPRGHHVAHLDRHVVPQGKEREALSAGGLAARITIDCGWSADQMWSRLVMLFQRRFVKQAGQKFTFTYLQCVQGSRVLFVPPVPGQGWTGEQVLRICGHGPLYILSHLDYPPAQKLEKETPAVNGQESCKDGASQKKKSQEDFTTEKLPNDLETVLRLFRQQNVAQSAETQILVRRRNFLHGALKAVKRPDFCFRNTPVVAFRGEGGGEASVRDFFRSTLLELHHSCVFEGRPGRLFLTRDLAALENRRYYEAGVLIGWSLTHGGPGPRCLHPALFQLMCGHKPCLEDFSCTDIADGEVSLLSCTDVKLLSPSLCNWVSSCGLPDFSAAQSDEMPAVYEHLVQHHIYHRVASMISQFKDGLNSCGGLWGTIESNWELFVPVMTSEQQQPVTLEEFTQLFTVCYSQSDCQMRAAEAVTVAHWETVLTLISGGQADLCFEDLIAFITGADRPPPLGFPTLISLRFYSQDAGVSSERLPHASGALELFLPRGAAGADHLLTLLRRAVREALGSAHRQTKEQGKEGSGS
ncbi:uncharacterized protein LOC114853674 isoform X2 [Betta splendens]|uniref:Uncharacterized protein LOC114853674 isoform X2 n=1 Tax=Betta splendens TaxID=158456 RepID=A0A9W2XRE9_BETSP|nr:uncharacterized protein LOC114853674 isoform X2 [Betta splendens]